MSFLINLFGHCFLFFKEQSPCIGSEYIFDNTRSGASIRRLEIRSELISFKVTLSSKLTRNIQYILKWPYLFHLRHRFSMKKKMKKKNTAQKKKRVDCFIRVPIKTKQNFVQEERPWERG